MTIRNSLFCAAGMVLAWGPWSADAGTVNIDLEAAASPTYVGAGPIGLGTHWNGISGDTNDLDDENGVGTEVDIAYVEFDVPFLGIGGNDLLIETLYRTNGDKILRLKLLGLRPSEPYKLAVYSGGGEAMKIDANGVVSTITGGALTPMPGNEGEHYQVLENVIANAAGEIDLSSENTENPGTISMLAAIQIQGWFAGEAEPWKCDAHISKKRLTGYKGGDIYSTSYMASQKKNFPSAGGAKVKCYARFENDGDTFGTFQFTGPKTNRKAKRVYREGGANISAEVTAGLFLPVLEPGEIRTVKMTIKPKPRGKKKLKFDDRLMVKPNGNVPSELGDLITARTVVKK